MVPLTTAPPSSMTQPPHTPRLQQFDYLLGSGDARAVTFFVLAIQDRRRRAGCNPRPQMFHRLHLGGKSGTWCPGCPGPKCRCRQCRRRTAHVPHWLFLPHWDYILMGDEGDRQPVCWTHPLSSGTKRLARLTTSFSRCWWMRGKVSCRLPVKFETPYNPSFPGLGWRRWQTGSCRKTDPKPLDCQFS